MRLLYSFYIICGRLLYNLRANSGAIKAIFTFSRALCMRVFSGALCIRGRGGADKFNICRARGRAGGKNCIKCIKIYCIKCISCIICIIKKPKKERGRRPAPNFMPRTSPQAKAGPRTHKSRQRQRERPAIHRKRAAEAIAQRRQKRSGGNTAEGQNAEAIN